MFFDPISLLFLLAALGIAGVAHWWVGVVIRETSAIPTRSGASGADAASAVLQSAGVTGVFVEDATGQQLDHYAPNEKGILLRPEVYNGRSLAAVGIAGHETGHAIQDAARHPLLPARTWIVLSATCGSLIGLIMFVGGFLIVESILIYLGIFVFCVTVAAQLFNLVVEHDASRRARRHLLESGVITPEEEPAIRRVMWAAACTYLAATLTSIPTAYHYLIKPRRAARQQQQPVASPVAETVVEDADRGPRPQALGGVAAAVERLRRREVRA
jgi:uncharacterized protein